MENNNVCSKTKNNRVGAAELYDSLRRNRPLSYYENSLSNNLPSKSELKSPDNVEGSPTQMHCLATTVPQNIASQNIAGKHAPTRNSLRHSRMIVMNKSGQVIREVPSLIKYYQYVKILLIVITFLGTVLCTLSLLLLVWTPNIRPRDNPYWSAVPVIFSGMIGFIFLYFFPRKSPDTKLNFWILLIKFTSIMASVLAGICAFTIFGYAVIHLRALTTMTCSPPDKVNTTCLCSTDPSRPASAYSYHYIDLTCTDVNNILYGIILFSCIVNAIVGVSEILYLYLHWYSRNTYSYTRVQNTQNQNKLKVGNR